jgi:hypothetical protein
MTKAVVIAIIGAGAFWLAPLRAWTVLTRVASRGTIRDSVAEARFVFHPRRPRLLFDGNDWAVPWLVTVVRPLSDVMSKLPPLRRGFFFWHVQFCTDSAPSAGGTCKGKDGVRGNGELA